MINDPGKLFLTLRNSATAAHVAHLSTTSYAAHKALNEYYDEIIDLADRFAESWMGLNDGKRISFTGTSFKLETDATKMLKGVRAEIESAQKECDDSMIKQILDDAKELVCDTIYLLTLK